VARGGRVTGSAALDHTFELHRSRIRDAAGRPGQDDHMARIPLATTIVVTTMVSAILVGPASVAAASSPVPSNRGWITGGSSDDEPDPRR
jgi:hypothetical protein